MRISDWSSDVCSSDLRKGQRFVPELAVDEARIEAASRCDPRRHHRELERIDADIALSDDRVERVRRGPSLVVFPHLPRAVGDGPIALVAPRKPEFLAEPEQPGGGSHRDIAEPGREPVEIDVAGFDYGRRHVEAAVGAETGDRKSTRLN